MLNHKIGLALIAALMLSLTACRPSMEPRDSIGQHVDTKVAVGFAAARTALAALDAAEVYYLDSTKFNGENDPRLLASAERVEKLKAVRAVLERVRQHIAGDVKPDLSQVLADLELLLASAKTAGIKIPQDTGPALKALQEMVR